MSNEVEEMQGLYGAFSLSERVLQKIWLNGDFEQGDLHTESGKSLRILDPGRWNLLEGPDFLEARLELDGQQVVGDVEVHFYAADWAQHDHGGNRNFANVRLHVVLYPNPHPHLDGQDAVRTSKGACPELLYLMPLLDRDLEDYAVDDALLELEQIDTAEWMLRFMELPLEARRARLQEGAGARWTRKVAFAKKRLLRSSWPEACHEFCLEVLGYARNRAPMGRLALSYSIEDFASGRAEVEALFAEERPRWRLSGLRPANHPRIRLTQYANICKAHPDWPERLNRILAETKVGNGSLNGAAFRKRSGLAELAERIANDVFSGKLAAKRLNTLVCDALLPLAQAAGILDAEAHWQHWPAGDAPTRLHAFMKQAQIIDRSNPFSNGQVQGGLQLLIQQ